MVAVSWYYLLTHVSNGVVVSLQASCTGNGGTIIIPDDLCEKVGEQVIT